MSRVNWEVMTGVGEHCLGGIAEDVARWNRLGAELPALSEAAEYWQEQANDDAAPLLAMAFDGVDDIQTSLLRTTTAGGPNPESAARALAFALATHKLEQFQRGTSYGVWKKRARLTVLEPGVTVEGLALSFSDQIRKAPKREARPGEVFEGRIHELKSSPEEGGRVSLTTWRSALSLTGLVDIHEVEPLVKLEVFAKRS